MSKTPLYDLGMTEFPKQRYPELLWQGLAQQLELAIFELRSKSSAKDDAINDAARMGPGDKLYAQSHFYRTKVEHHAPCIRCDGVKFDSGIYCEACREKIDAEPPKVGISASEAADPMNYKGMFEAAVSSLAEISAALGIDEEDAASANGNDLILEAIARKNEAIMAAITRPATPPASEPHLQLHGMAGYYVLRGAIEALRVTGRFIDEEGESTDALEDFADAAREAAITLRATPGTGQDVREAPTEPHVYRDILGNPAPDALQSVLRELDNKP